MPAVTEIKDPGGMKTPGNEEIEYRDTSLIVRFPGPRSVLSTSWLNGGYREDLRAVFNHQISLDACEACHSGGCVKAYLEEIASSLSLDPAFTAGLVTRAEMKNAAVVSESFRDVSVTAIVTAGVDKNGGRAGDPASYFESNGTFEPVGGTINILLIINASLPEYAMTRAVVTATEAKTVALQQLMAKSLYSSGIATGSGTDMICVIAHPGADIYLTDAGKHSGLGELIGRSVIRATTTALDLETGLSPESQGSVIARLSRFFISEDDIWEMAMQQDGTRGSNILLKERFILKLREKARDPVLVALVAAVLHIIDEMDWGLITEKAAKQSVLMIIRGCYPSDDIAGFFEKQGSPRELILMSLVFVLCSRIIHEEME